MRRPRSAFAFPAVIPGREAPSPPPCLPPSLFLVVLSCSREREGRSNPKKRRKKPLGSNWSCWRRYEVPRATNRQGCYMRRLHDSSMYASHSTSSASSCREKTRRFTPVPRERWWRRRTFATLTGAEGGSGVVAAREMPLGRADWGGFLPAFAVILEDPCGLKHSITGLR